MLLRFSAANYLSLREPQELSLTVSSLQDIETGLIDCAAAPAGKVLPAVVIYGANASGKSNIVAAIRWMRQGVLFSHSRGEPRGGVPRTPFALDARCKTAPSAFSVDFIVDGVRYNYGFEASDEAITTEWLFAFPSGKRQTLFERRGAEFSFGRNLKGRNRVISDLTRPNSLFLSAAIQNGHEKLTRISNFFRSLQIDSKISVGGGVASTRFAKDDVDRRVIEFLGKIGTGVVEYRRQEIKYDESMRAAEQELFAVIQKFIKEPLELDFGGEKNITIELAHKGNDGKLVYLDLEDESAGTRRLLILLGLAFKALDKGTLLIVDELDASLHTRACEAILELFTSRRTNPKGAQLIATTHDTNLLSSRLLRRDQVWFTEKNSYGATSLYPLTDIRTRKGDNIEKGYLQGRYGAIPFAGGSDKLVAEG